MLAAVDVQPFAPVCLGVFWLVRRARDRLEGGRPLTGTMTLPAVSLEQRRAGDRKIGPIRDRHREQADVSVAWAVMADRHIEEETHR